MNDEEEPERSAPEAVTPEVMGAPPAVPAEQQPETGSALERAAEAALAMPGVPGRDEFLALAMQARILSMSGAAPKAVRNNPHVAFHLAMIGRDLGISPSAAIALIDVIGEGDKTQASLSPQLLNGQIRRLGLGSIRPVYRDNERCVARALGPNEEELGVSEFTWEDAQIAGLVDRRCSDALSHVGSCKCRQGWRTYPKRMLWWRAAGYCADDFFPEAGLGLYAPEELGAVVDEEGRAIDPATVELPEGYDRALPKGEEGGDPAALWALQERIRALPQEMRDDLRAQWGQASKLRGYPVYRLSESGRKVAESLVGGFETRAKAAGWDGDEALVEVRAAVVGALVCIFGGPCEDMGFADEPGEETAPPPPERQPTTLEESKFVVDQFTDKQVTAALKTRDLAHDGTPEIQRERLIKAMAAEEAG